MIFASEQQQLHWFISRHYLCLYQYAELAATSQTGSSHLISVLSEKTFIPSGQSDFMEVLCKVMRVTDSSLETRMSLLALLAPSAAVSPAGC